MRAKRSKKHCGGSCGRKSAWSRTIIGSWKRAGLTITSLAKGGKRGHHGKEQHYFLCDFDAPDSRINVATEHPEFRAWQWIEPGKFQVGWLPEMKLEVYRAVFRDFFKIEL